MGSTGTPGVLFGIAGRLSLVSVAGTSIRPGVGIARRMDVDGRDPGSPGNTCLGALQAGRVENKEGLRIVAATSIA